MNTDCQNIFAKQLADNPSLFGATKEAMLAEFLTAYVNGTLTSEDTAEVDDLLKNNARAKTIHDNILAANRFLASDEGKAWLKSPVQGISAMQTAAIQPVTDQFFFDRLSEWMEALFRSLTCQAAYSDTTAGSVVRKFESVVRKFDSPAGSRYRSRLVRDTAGQWRLRVSTSDADAAKRKVCLKIKEEAPVLSFVEGEPGHFLAEVFLTEEMARALESGHCRPEFPLIE